MIGKHTIVVQNRAVHYKFDIERNISIIRGNSATGKTTLIGMIADYQSQGSASGVELICDKRCVAMTGLGERWKNSLDSISDSIVFIDEGEKYVSSKEFAEYIRGTDNYYVIATRNNLYDIPYSVEAVYEIKTSGKYGRLKKTYNSLRRLYTNYSEENIQFGSNDIVIVEDERSGYQFFEKVCEGFRTRCITARGKGNILSVAEKTGEEKKLIIADGAAFGPEMANVYGLANKRSYTLFLPESFEWLILNSNIITNGDIKKILEKPYDYIESGKYFSWEQYFTTFLIDISRNKEYAYSKSKINNYFLSKRNIRMILEEYFTDI